MAVKVIDNTRKITNSATVKANIFLRLMAERVERIAEPKTPKRVGDLKRNILKTVIGLKSVVKWQQRYAAYQERGADKQGNRVVKNYSTPGTGKGFAENAIKQADKETEQIAKQAGLI